jgi:hypothetical protein
MKQSTMTLFRCSHRKPGRQSRRGVIKLGFVRMSLEKFSCDFNTHVLQICENGYSPELIMLKSNSET